MVKNKLTKAIICGILALSMTGCVETPVNETITDAEGFFERYGADTEFICNATINEAIALTNPDNEQTVTIPVTLSSTFYQSKSTSNSDTNIHGDSTRQLVMNGLTSKYGGEFYVTRSVSDTGRATDTTYWKEGELDSLNNWTDSTWKKATNRGFTAAILAFNKFDSEHLSDGEYAYDENNELYKITGNILEILTEQDAESFINAAGISGLTVQSVDWPTYVGESGDMDGMTDIEKKLQGAGALYTFSNSMRISKIVSDEFTYDAKVSLNNTTLDAEVTVDVSIAISDHKNVDYSDTLLPESVVEATKDSTTLGDLFSTPTPSAEATTAPNATAEATAESTAESTTDAPSESATTTTETEESDSVTDQPVDGSDITTH